ncbi:MAG: hypothetical protein H0U21_17435 [Acidimicrobiia bacterium]|nr:hypothetical protein [Acidimicrobiia bacterium]
MVVGADRAQELPDRGDDRRVGVVRVERGAPGGREVAGPALLGAFDLIERCLFAAGLVAAFVEDTGERSPAVPAGEDLAFGCGGVGLLVG